MKKILFIAALYLCMFECINAQDMITYDFTFRIENNVKVIRILRVGDLDGVDLSGATFALMPLQPLNGLVGAPIAIPGGQCNRASCIVPIPNGLNTAAKYILVIDAGANRFWGTISFEASAKLLPSKNADELDSQIQLDSNTPLTIARGASIQLTENRIVINEDRMLALNDTDPPKRTAVVKTTNDGGNGANITNATLELDKKLVPGETKSFSLTNPATINAAVGGGTLAATGKIALAGGGGDTPSDPKFDVTLTSEAAKRKGHNFLVSGSWTVRRPKFSSLFGRFSSCYSEVINAQGEITKIDAKGNGMVAPDRTSEECRGKSLNAFQKFYFGAYKTGSRSATDSSTPGAFFAGLEPKITFSVGSRSNESDKTITGDLPFVFYLFNDDRNIKQFADGSYDKKKDVPLGLYGGWRESGWFDLADIKLSVGPKVEFYKNDDRDNVKWYDFDWKSTMISARADFEFFRWLGTVSEQKKLLKADFSAAGKSDSFFKLKAPKFGWKFVPYLVFEAGRSHQEDEIKKTLGGVAQTQTIPSYSIFRGKIGGDGRLEWVFAGGRIFGITTTYELIYLGESEKNTYVTDDVLLLRSVRGYHPHFKTSFDFTLDPAKRFSFNTTWENGLSLPGLEPLNKVSSGITIKY